MEWLLVLVLGTLVVGTQVGTYRLHVRVLALETRNRERDRLVAWRDQSPELPQQPHQHPDGKTW